MMELRFRLNMFNFFFVVNLIFQSAFATSTTPAQNCHAAINSKGQLLRSDLEMKLSELVNQLDKLNPNYKFEFNLENEIISESIFSVISWKGFKVRIDAQPLNPTSAKVPYISLSLVHLNERSVLIENLESHSLTRPNPTLLFGASLDQRSHKGMELREFKNLKKWLSDYLKSAGYKSVVSNDQSSYTVSRFYRFLGMKPVENTIIRIDEYMKYLLHECKLLRLEEIKKMEDISKFLNSFFLPSQFVDSLESFYSNYRKANPAEKATLEADFKSSLKSTGLIKDFEFLKDSQNKLIGVRGAYENRKIYLFFAPDFLIESSGSFLFTWSGMLPSHKKLILEF